MFFFGQVMQKNYEVLLGKLDYFIYLFVIFRLFVWINKLFYGLAVSQFTLCGFLKGNKPDFHVAMPPQKAEPFYASLVDRFKNSYHPDLIKGIFFFFLFNLFVTLCLLV